MRTISNSLTPATSIVIGVTFGLRLPSPATMTTTLEFRLRSSKESWTDFPKTIFILDRSRVIDTLAVDNF
ncbi:unnamed protein product [Cyberlindnera jadinii]|uniref:Uncharacterized protein n=1 Tax=Cyberlindnera jadinii (strain ATCC 18201 / CBS 1600 / BCRC 20928 / JCM 3617 / NBRC 0987 / NRRL Y-1542) TaxID=983966 RepID=A0A0H5C268_CYBJN|nr:unnamed protein product [Cyberlindnera jadinii]